ncbi:hypothetical protein [Roseibium marinum]|uniref:Uncharacterized protein n=1 Tax=Roseibium marinum TaxID=281252 RepID=A0A2S3UM13_9HYPH|nr:hypothetical protein [Roseibium marinum]POF28762.1 hypothetical protein CLV41_11112 [Roseibium marinum]
MMFYRSHRFAAGLAVSLFPLQGLPALAFDPSGNDVADTFLELLDSEEGTVESYSAVDTSADTVTIRDLVITNDDKDDARVTIGSTTLTGGAIQDNGRLKLSSLDLENLELAADDGGMSLKNLKATGLLLPSAEEVKADKAPVNPGYSMLEITGVLIRGEDGQIADIEKITSSIDAMDGDLPTAGSFAVSGAKIDVDKVETKESKSLSELGYKTLTVDLSGSGKWDPETATLTVPELKINAEQAASVSLSFSLGGVTREVIMQLNRNSGEPQETMAALQAVTVQNIGIRLDDDSLTGRILDVEAQKAGVETPVYVERLTGSLPLMLGMLQNKDLQDKVQQAVTQFLTTPDSLEIKAAPGVPVPVAQIMGTAMLAPHMIPQILSISIAANE